MPLGLERFGGAGSFCPLGMSPEPWTPMWPPVSACHLPSLSFHYPQYTGTPWRLLEAILWLAGKDLGSSPCTSWEASGRHLGAPWKLECWETSGMHLGAPWKQSWGWLGSSWEASGSCWEAPRSSHGAGRHVGNIQEVSESECDAKM